MTEYTERFKALMLLASLRATPTAYPAILGSETLREVQQEQVALQSHPRTRLLIIDSYPPRVLEDPRDAILRNAPVRPSRPMANHDAQVFAGPRGEGKGGATKWFRINGEISAEVKPQAVEIEIYDTIGRDWWSGEGVEAKEFANELKKIPRGQEILLRVSSNGGSVNDGLLIYNLLKERSTHLVCQVDSVAASIASIIVLAGRELRMPRNAKLMIHNPWSYAEGDSREMRKVAEKLDTYRDSLSVIYHQKTGKTVEEIHQLMDEEKWMNGDEAKALGFCDVVTDEEPNFQACANLDFSGFKRVPEQLKKQKKTGAHNMNREEIIARLNELGVEFETNASDEQLQTLLTNAEAQAKTKAKAEAVAKAKADAKAKAAKAKAKAGARQTEPADDTADDDADADDDSDVDSDDASHPANRLRNRLDPQAFDAMQAELKAIRAERNAERKQRIEMEVDACVNEDRIPAAQREKWVNRILKAGKDGDEVLADLKAMTPRPPGTDPVGVIIQSEDPRAIERALIANRSAVNSWLRGNSVSPEAIATAARIAAVTIQANRKRLDPILAANTIDPALKRTVLLNDVMRAFQRKLLAFNVFTIKHESVPLQGTNKLAVPFYDLHTTASTNYVAATGYTFANNTAVGVRELTIDKRKFQTMDFSSDTFRRQPYFDASMPMQMIAEQLAVDVWTDFMSLITATNYPTVALNREPGSFDSDDMATLMGKADDADWPEIGRAFVGGTGHKVALNQDDAIKHWQNSGSTDSLRKGSVGKLSDFDVYFSSRIPNNSEDLSAFICLPPAAIFATAPILPAPGVRQQLLSYEVVIDPQTGVAFEYRYGADVWKDTDREVVECNYGYAKGNGSALQRITAGANEFSSSSSASSVNSSSSSSSSPSF
jgi:ATP-dependent Clp protease protease subunit